MRDRPAFRLTRRRFLLATAAGGASAVSGYQYARRVEPGWTEVVRRDMPFAGLPSSLAGRTLAHVSDLHVGTTDADHLANALKAVSAARPDVVVITGDLTSSEAGEQLDALPAVLDHLTPPPLGTFTTLGNHDYGRNWAYPDVADRLTKRMTRYGVRVLRNEAAEVGGLQLVGVDDLWAGRCNPKQVVRELDPGRPAVALCHNPDGVESRGWGPFAGWILAGHTHGGQVKPPFFAPPVTHLRNRRYYAGAFDLGNDRHLYVNRGLGYVRKLRFNARPEITLFRLVPAVA